MRFFILLGFICLAGLASTAWTYNTLVSTHYTCENGEQLTVDRRESSIRLHTDTGVFVLPEIPSAAGSRFSDGTTEFWCRGDKARLQDSEKHKKLYCLRLGMDS